MTSGVYSTDSFNVFPTESIPQIVSTFSHRWLPDAGIYAELLQLTDSDNGYV